MRDVLLAHALAPYAALLALLFVFLSGRVANMRRLLRENAAAVTPDVLERGSRAQGNFAEYVPFALLLIWLAGSAGTSFLLVHVMAILLVIGRIAHAYSILVVEPQKKRFEYRALGIGLTLLVFVIAAAALLIAWCGLLFQ